MIEAIDNFIDYLNSPNLGDKQTIEVYIVKKPKYITSMSDRSSPSKDSINIKLPLGEEANHFGWL